MSNVPPGDPNQQGYQPPPAAYGAPAGGPAPVAAPGDGGPLSPTWMMSDPPPAGWTQKQKMVAGILGILLNGLGAHSFYLGNTREAVKLARRVLESGWLSHQRMPQHRNLVETWSVLIFLEAGQLEEAKKLLSSRSDSSVSTGRIAVALRDERWDDALADAKRALAAPDVLKESRPTIAALGLFAAKKLDLADEARCFEEVLAAQPLGKLAKENPALARYL